jgi:hypothetical protein
MEAAKEEQKVERREGEEKQTEDEKIVKEVKDLIEDEEEPLEIQDYTRINGWEEFINDLDLLLVKWSVQLLKRGAIKRTKSVLMFDQCIDPQSWQEESKQREVMTYRIEFRSDLPS